MYPDHSDDSMGPLPLPSVFSYIVSQVSTICKFNDAIFSDKKLLLKRLTIICHKRYTKKIRSVKAKDTHTFTKRIMDG